MPINPQSIYTDADDILQPLADVINQLAEYGDPLESPALGQRMMIDQVRVTMPIELRMEVTETGDMTLKGSAPTQRFELSIMPVFHQMRVRIGIDHGE
jgi:hypothetical protein